MINDYCVDQQISDWHFRTICRYKLVEKPIKTSKFYNLLDKLSLNCSSVLKAIVKDKAFSQLLPPVDSLITGKPAQDLEQDNEKITKAYLNHVKLWEDNLKKITLHVTSGKLLSNIELYTSFYMAFCCCGNQSPHIIKSKRAVAEFNVVRAAITGARSSLRNQNKLYFAYKWAYIAAELPLFQLESDKITPGHSQCLGVNNIFIFPELDKLNYNLFEPIVGFDLAFSYNCSIIDSN